MLKLPKKRFILIPVVLLGVFYVFGLINSKTTFALIKITSGAGGGNIAAPVIAAAGCNSQPGSTGNNSSNKGPDDYEAYFTCQSDYLNPSNYEIWEKSPKQITVDWGYTCTTGAENGYWQPINGTISGSNLATKCNDSNIGQSFYQSPNYLSFTISPSSTACSTYNNTMCKIFLEWIPSNPGGNDTYLGGRITADITKISSTSSKLSIQVAAGSPKNNPASGSGYSITATGGGVTKTIKTSQGWYNANQATVYGSAMDRTFQASCRAGGTAYIGWEGAVYGMDGNNSPGTNGSFISTQAAESGEYFQLYQFPPGTSPNGSATSPPTNGKLISVDISGHNMQNVGNEWLYGTEDLSDSGNISKLNSDAQAIDYLNTPYSASFQYNAGYTYEWWWSPSYAQYGVPITESIPFSENPIDLNINCWSLTGNSEVNTQAIVASQTATFNHEVGNKGPYTASYTWRVQGCYYPSGDPGYCSSSTTNPDSNPNWYKDCSNDTNSNGINTNAGAVYCQSHSTLPISTNFESPYYVCSPGSATSPNYCPSYSGDKALVNYNFPSTANNGDGYCERIYYTDVNGPNINEIAASSAVCVNYKTTIIENASCTQLKFNSGTFLSSKTQGPMFYAVYAYTPTAGGNPDNSGNQNFSQWSDYYAMTNTQHYPDVTNESLTDPSGSTNPTTSPVLTNHTITYTMNPGQYLSGNVSWYALTFNVWKTSGGLYALRIDNIATASASNCFAPLSCTIYVTPSALLNNQANAVLGGSGFNYKVTFNSGSSNGNPIEVNTGPSPVYYNMSATAYYTNQSDNLTIDAMSANDSYTTIPYSFNATTDNTKAYSIIVNESYPNTNLSYNSACSVNVSSYDPFSYSLNGTAILVPSYEDPSSVNQNYNYQESGGGPNNLAPNNLSTDGSLYYVPFSGAQQLLQDYGSVGPNTNETYGPPLPPINAGDAFCAILTLSPTSGYVGPGGSYLGPDPTGKSSNACATVHNEPYVQFFGNDIIGDSAFNTSSTTTCSGANNSSGIYTFSQASSSSNGTAKGSYSQFGAEALGDILGFGTAGLRSTSPTGPLGLSFSNTSNTSGNGPDTASLGGQVGFSQCASTPTYNNDELPGAQTYTTNMAINNTSPQDYNLSPPSGGNTATINTSPLTIDPGVKAAIFVNGNAYIGANITYAGANSGWSFNQIPSLWIIATGNIYIAPNVTQLDGVYVAQPNSSSATGTSGLIYTCANSSGPFPLSYLYGNSTTNPSSGCDQQLTINGAFIDQASILQRSYSSVRYSNPGENPQTTPTHSCGTPNQDVNPNQLSEPTCAAEVFNFSPEVYLSQPALKPLSGIYEYITSLSPTL